MTTEEKFWSMVAIGGDGECWDWLGPKFLRGYGRFSYGGAQYYAHRFSYSVSLVDRAELRPGLSVLHRCDRPSCVNPGHLFLGTQADNMKDMTEKGRRSRGSDHGKKTAGEGNGNARLTVDEVVRLRKRYAAGEKQVELATSFGIKQPEVSEIVRGEKWKHAGGPVGRRYKVRRDRRRP